MSFVFNFSAWVAVSKKEQVEDKDSLKKQLEACVEAGQRLGGRHVATYKADGYSRSGFFNLSDAAAKIPDLKRLLDEIPTWDVLICKNFDRYRSIGDMLFAKVSLENRKQLFSVEQATTIYPPDQYDPYRDTSTALMLKLVGVSNVYAISKIVDNFRVGIPKRAEAGMFTKRPPKGYVNRSIYDKRKLIEYKLEQDPAVCRVLVDVKNMYMTGEAAEKCAKYCRDHGVYMTTPGVFDMLRNPFYAGIVTLDETMRDGKKRIPNPNAQTFHGSHVPLWSYEEYLAIQAELQRRTLVMRRKRLYPLSGILHCSICGSVMRANVSKDKSYYRCPQKRHDAIPQDKAYRAVADEIKRQLWDYKEGKQKEETPVAVDNRATIAKYEQQRARVQTAYQTDPETYTMEEFGKRIRELNTMIAALKAEQTNAKAAAATGDDRRRERLELVELLPHMYEYITEREPHIVNVRLSKLIERATVYPGGRVAVELAE